MGELKQWVVSDYRKPLLLEGARQVGKTWLLLELGRQMYEQTAYVDFEESSTLRSIFDGDFDLELIVSQLQIATGVTITPGRTLIILDEIQACPRALTALKYFNQRANQYHIACAGSLLGVALHEQVSFPVGKANFLSVRPLTFLEYLRAIDQDALADGLTGLPTEQAWTVMAPFHDRLITHLKDYMFIGGMPEVVSSFAEQRDHDKSRQIQQEILKAYDRDFSKHAPPDQVPKIRAIWESIPGQLAKEQGRFTYSTLGSGARNRTHSTAIEWLRQAGVILQVKRVSAPRLPLSGYVDASAFKLYLTDIGLLGALAGLSASTVIEGNRLFTEFRGAFTEQFAAMELAAICKTSPCYWTNGGGTAEVDFIIQRDQDVVPIEVKASVNLKSQSLRVYRDKYNPDLCIRSSLAPYARHQNLVDLPLYALSSVLNPGYRKSG